MNMRITPRTLSGTVPAIPSKSYAQRLLIAALLCDDTVALNFEKSCEDIESTQSAVEALRRGESVIDCKSSATAARILLQVMAVRFPGAEMICSEQLSKRPLETLITFPAKAGVYEISGKLSSQYISGLMFALPLLEGESKIVLTDPLESAGYVDITIDVLSQFGIEIHQDGQKGWTVPGNQRYVAPEYIECEGDWSNAPVWIAAGAVVTGLGVDTLQPDGQAFLPFCEYSEQPDGSSLSSSKIFGRTNSQSEWISSKSAEPQSPPILAGLRSDRPAARTAFRLSGSARLPEVIDVSQCPDLTPVLAVMAATREGQTRIVGTHRLRIKESDRIESVVEMLRNLGGIAEVQGDDILITGQAKLAGGEVNSFEDHRIVMAATLASCWCESPVTIIGAEAVAKSYPHFFDDFCALGGQVEFE